MSGSAVSIENGKSAQCLVNGPASIIIHMRGIRKPNKSSTKGGLNSKDGVLRSHALVNQFFEAFTVIFNRKNLQGGNIGLRIL
jgi:hypothetical protein